MRRLPPVWLLLPLAACSADPQGTPLAHSRHEIVNGTPSDAVDDAVVDLYTSFSDGRPRTRCTGTLVAPDIILTALHCVSFYDNDGIFTCNPDGTLSATSPGAGLIGQTVPPNSVEVHFGAAYHADSDAVGARIFGSGSSQICRNDIALVVLDRELTADPVTMRLERPTLRRELMRAVGYGQTEASGSSGRYVRTGVRVTDVGPDDTGTTSTAAPRTLVLGEGACHGDSGGPAFSEETGALTAVYSLSGGPTCTSVGVRNVYTRLAPFAYLVQEAFDFAGREILAEPVASSGAGGATAQGGQTTNGGSTPAESGRTSSGGDEGVGSGSRRDSSCACELHARASDHAWLVSMALALLLPLRRKLRRSGSAAQLTCRDTSAG